MLSGGKYVQMLYSEYTLYLCNNNNNNNKIYFLSPGLPVGFSHSPVVYLSIASFPLRVSCYCYARRCVEIFVWKKKKFFIGFHCCCAYVYGSVSTAFFVFKKDRRARRHKFLQMAQDFCAIFFRYLNNVAFSIDHGLVTVWLCYYVATFCGAKQ